MWSRKNRLAALIMGILFFAIVKYAIDRGVWSFSQALTLIAYASLPFAGGLITLSFCSLLGDFSREENSAIYNVLRLISEGLARNFSIGFLATAYLILIRPTLVARLPYLPFVEWTAIAIGVIMTYTITKPPSEDSYQSPTEPNWRKHTQEITRETGRDLVRITSAFEQFVNNEVKEPLLVYLTLHLQRLGENEEEILRILTPLIDYDNSAERRRSYSSTFPWTRKALAMRDKQTREILLDSLIEKIGKL